MFQELTNTQLQQCFSQSDPIFIGLVDTNIKVKRVTDPFAKLCGFKQARDFIGLSSYDINCAAVESAAQFDQQFRRVIKTKKPMKILDIHTFADNSSHVHASIKAPVYDDKKEVIGAYIHSGGVEARHQQASLKLLDSLQRFFQGPSVSMSLEVISRYEQINLTHCESLCFYFYIRGYTIKEIARKLERSPRTVEEHVEHIKMKLGIRHRASFIEYAVMLKLFNLIPEVLIASDLS